MEYNTEIHDWWLILVNYFISIRDDEQKKLLALLQSLVLTVKRDLNFSHSFAATRPDCFHKDGQTLNYCVQY